MTEPDVEQAAVQAWLRALDDGAGPRHADVTPAVEALAQLGLAAVEPLLEPLDAGAELTRLRAQRAVEQVIERHHGFRPGAGFPSAAAEQAARAELLQIGYRHDDARALRAEALGRLRAWLAQARSAPS